MKAILLKIKKIVNKESVPKAPGTDWSLNEVSIKRGTTLTAV